MKSSEKQTIEFWKRAFESRGFTEEGHLPVSCRGTPPRPGDYLTWHFHKGFHIGINMEQLKHHHPVGAYIIYTGLEKLATTTFLLAFPGTLYQEPGQALVDYREFLFIIDALVEPKRLPLCIGIEWAEELVTAFLRRLPVEPATTSNRRSRR